MVGSLEGLWAGEVIITRSAIHGPGPHAQRRYRLCTDVIGCTDMDAMIVSATFCRKDRS